jgi:mRNA deadenylase 3'-5' endonuclease subunit Ccr4
MHIISYNVLAEAYLQPKYYPRAKPEHLDLQWRRAALLGRIAAFNADAICLQEVEHDLFLALQSRLPQYVGNYAQKAGGRPDGCASFVRLPVVATRTLTYGDGSGHVALMTEVEVDGQRLGIANTHFKWGPSETRVGLDQASELLDSLDARPWIVCGDFNADPTSPLVAEFHRRGFQDVYADLGGATCNANSVAKRIDFLMYRGMRGTPDQLPAIDGSTPFPSADQPSDHLAIGAEFTWR